MITRHTYKNLTWVDAEAPTLEEIRDLGQEYNLPHLVREELLIKTAHSKVNSYSNLIFLILHFPTAQPGLKDELEQEIDFIVGRDFLITAHYEPIDPLYEFTKRFETQGALEKMGLDDHAGYIFYSLIKSLYKTLIAELEKINARLKNIESNVFAGNEGQMVKTISVLNRELLDYRQTLRFHQEIWHSLEISAEKFFGHDFVHYVSSIMGEYNKLNNILSGHRDILNDMRETNDSLLSNKTSETMKTLTIMSFVVFPLTLIASIFGMNMRRLPLVGLPGDFWIVIGIMAVAVTIMFSYFKFKKWF